MNHNKLSQKVSAEIRHGTQKGLSHNRRGLLHRMIKIYCTIVI